MMCLVSFTGILVYSFEISKDARGKLGRIGVFLSFLNNNKPIPLVKVTQLRKKTMALEKENWNIEYTWIKAYAGHNGNELADKLAKEATRNVDI